MRVWLTFALLGAALAMQDASWGDTITGSIGPISQQKHLLSEMKGKCPDLAAFIERQVLEDLGEHFVETSHKGSFDEPEAASAWAEIADRCLG